jgi:hypothetical protein
MSSLRRPGSGAGTGFPVRIRTIGAIEAWESKWPSQQLLKVSNMADVACTPISRHAR